MNVVLGGKAIQIIKDSANPLDTLIHLSQDFPKYATSLTRRVVTNENITQELLDNLPKIPHGANLFWLNGVQIDAKDVHPFGLLKLLKKEKAVMQSLTAQGLQRPEAFKLVTHAAISATQKDGNVLDALFDASDRPEGGDVIVWWNDMEKDSRYVLKKFSHPTLSEFFFIRYVRWSPSLYMVRVVIQDFTLQPDVFNLAFTSNVPWSLADDQIQSFQRRPCP